MKQMLAATLGRLIGGVNWPLRTGLAGHLRWHFRRGTIAALTPTLFHDAAPCPQQPLEARIASARLSSY